MAKLMTKTVNCITNRWRGYRHFWTRIHRSWRDEAPYLRGWSYTGLLNRRWTQWLGPSETSIIITWRLFSWVQTRKTNILLSCHVVLLLHHNVCFTASFVCVRFFGHHSICLSSCLTYGRYLICYVEEGNIQTLSVSLFFFLSWFVMQVSYRKGWMCPFFFSS